MEDLPRFKIIYLDDALRFLDSLDVKVRNKILYNIGRSKFVIDKELFKKFADSDIWEFRTLYNGIAYRILAFWDMDKEAIVMATHGFIKKSNKTPAKEITKAEAIRRRYFQSKQDK